MGRRLLYVAVAVLVITVPAIAGYLVLIGSGDDTTVQRGAPVGNGILRAGNRDGLEVCVEFVDVSVWSADAGAALETVGRLVEDLAAHPSFRERAADPPLSANVDVGCPSGIQRRRYRRGVEVPSRYLVFAFVMSDEERSSFRWSNYSIGEQEYVCSGDSCGGVTAAAYFGISEAVVPVKVKAVLSEAIGLTPRR